MGERERDVVGDAQRQRAVLFVERVGRFRQEGDAADRPLVSADRDAEDRADPDRRHEAKPGQDRPRHDVRRLGGAGRSLAHAEHAVFDHRQVVRDEELPVRVELLVFVRVPVLRHLDEPGLRRRLHEHAAAIGRQQRERHDVVRNDVLNHA
jgi:hypothetical protein